MAKKKMEEEFTIDSEAIEQQTKVQTPVVQEPVQQKVSKVRKAERHDSEGLINPLRKEIITVKFIISNQAFSVNDSEKIFSKLRNQCLPDR